MPDVLDTPGWFRAGYTGAGCERYAENTHGEEPTNDETRVGGWIDAGYRSPDCERFWNGSALNDLAGR